MSQPGKYAMDAAEKFAATRIDSHKVGITLATCVQEAIDLARADDARTIANLKASIVTLEDNLGRSSVQMYERDKTIAQLQAPKGGDKTLQEAAEWHEARAGLSQCRPEIAVLHRRFAGAIRELMDETPRCQTCNAPLAEIPSGPSGCAFCILRSANEELRKDKERLDWLARSSSVVAYQTGLSGWPHKMFDSYSKGPLRQAIDAAMSSSTKKSL